MVLKITIWVIFAVAIAVKIYTKTRGTTSIELSDVQIANIE